MKIPLHTTDISSRMNVASIHMLKLTQRSDPYVGHLMVSADNFVLCSRNYMPIKQQKTEIYINFWSSSEEEKIPKNIILLLCFLPLLLLLDNSVQSTPFFNPWELALDILNICFLVRTAVSEAQ